MPQNITDANATPLDQVNRELDEQQAKQRALKLGISYIDLRHFAIEVDALRLSSKEIVEEAHAIPFDLTGKKIRLAFFGDRSALAEKLAADIEAKEYSIDWIVCSMDGFEYALEQYNSPMFKRHGIEIRTETKETEKRDTTAHLQDFAKLESQLKTLTSAELLNEIELLSVAAQASDIHFQPKEIGVVVRIRVDGVLHDVLALPEKIAEQIVSRVKYESGMRANVTAAPQDGSMEIEVNNRKIEFRVSTLPTPTVESIVMRVLDSSRGISSFSELGFTSHVEQKIITALNHHNGIVLVTGPTGSGKTTTLYSMLAELNTPERKLVTLEDPIEYHLDGVSQSEVDETQDYTFDTGFRSLLRHDPDVILVGEIRTLPTARLAFEAALTGHTVLSSLHANSAVGALSRLRNLGVQDVNIAPTISAIFAQRLVRRVCTKCHTREILSDDSRVKGAIDRLKKIFPDREIPQEWPVAQGCDECSNTGYMGQVAVAEAFIVTDKIREMIKDGVFETDILNYLRNETDFLSLWEDGMAKVFEGVTTIEELQRVVGEV